MPSQDNNIQFNQYQKQYKTLFIIYAYLESLIEKIDGCKNNPEKSSPTKAGDNISSGASTSTELPFRDMEKSVMYTELKTA